MSSSLNTLFSLKNIMVSGGHIGEALWPRRFGHFCQKWSFCRGRTAGCREGLWDLDVSCGSGANFLMLILKQKRRCCKFPIRGTLFGHPRLLEILLFGLKWLHKSVKFPRPRHHFFLLLLFRPRRGAHFCYLCCPVFRNRAPVWEWCKF